MRDYDNPRPGSRAGITSALTTMTLRESRPTSISSFSDISASSTNIYSTHARRVRSVRKLRQILGPEDDTVERMDTTTEKELPLPPTTSTPLSSPFLSPPNNDHTITSQSPTSDFASEDEMGEKSTSLVYTRLVKLEKLKRRFGEEVPKELVFFDQPTLSYKGRSLSSPNVMNFAEKKDESFLGHIKNASTSTIPIANVSQAALRRSRAKLGAWKSKSKKQSGDIDRADNGNDEGWMRIIKGGKSLDAEVVNDSSCPVRLTSLEGSDWEYISKSNDRAFNVNFSDNAFMQPQFNTPNENSHVNLQGVQIVRSRSTLIIDRTSEDDERMQVHSTVESSNKSMLSIIMDSPIGSSSSGSSSGSSSEQLLNSLYPLAHRRSHDETLGNLPSQTDPARAPRKVRSAVTLASKTRNSATQQPPLPSSLSHSETTEPSTPSPTSHSSYHGKETSWNDENIGLSSEDDRRRGRSTSRGSKPKGPRPSSRSRPRTTDNSITTPTTPSSGFRHSDEAVEHWQLLERQHKVPDSSNRESNSVVSPILKSRTLPSRHSLPPPPPPTKASIPKPSDGTTDPPPPPSITGLTTLSAQKIIPKTAGTVIYFYHRGVVRLAVDDGTRGPKTVQTVHMRDVLNYLRDMRYVH
ncbi:hypothetical protein Clacol_005756 [Clathrus columnatus]|uniref:Uncharacterized protein n=1 Tax=Clathrus columnatus TaxID=1419009 RepID=A0AAV5ADG0_9AGAM|nr:hypothetical protein Clacol_005756 [Clathrus columnatus]